MDGMLAHPPGNGGRAAPIASPAVATDDVVIRQPGCLFCDIIAGELPAFVVLDEAATVGFLDTHPLFPGHVLVVPRSHVDSYDDAGAPILAALAMATQRVSRAVQEATGAVGTFIATNVRVSQSVPHLHFHVVPRTRGDGLRGFFWPRTRYRDDNHAAEVAAALRAALRSLG
jgi:histidine triad (HIT) family protein